MDKPIAPQVRRTITRLGKRFLISQPPAVSRLGGPAPWRITLDRSQAARLFFGAGGVRFLSGGVILRRPPWPVSAPPPTTGEPKPTLMQEFREAPQDRDERIRRARLSAWRAYKQAVLELGEKNAADRLFLSFMAKRRGRLSVAALIGHKKASVTSKYAHKADAVLLQTADIGRRAGVGRRGRTTEAGGGVTPLRASTSQSSPIRSSSAVCRRSFLE